LGDITFGVKEALIPLQAADFLVYEVRRYAADQFYGSPRQTRKSMEALMKERNLMVGYYDAEDFERHLRTRIGQRASQS
jgi:hypothetical protein